MKSETEVKFVVAGTLTPFMHERLQEVIQREFAGTAIPTPEIEFTVYAVEIPQNEVWDLCSEGARYAWLEKECSKRGYNQGQPKMFSNRKFAQLPPGIQRIVLNSPKSN